MLLLFFLALRLENGYEKLNYDFMVQEILTGKR